MKREINSVVDRPSPCVTPLFMTNWLLIFPSTITLACAPSSVIFTSRFIFMGIPKLTKNSKSFFLIYAIKGFFEVNEEKMKVYVMRIKFFQYLSYYKYLICFSSLGSEAALVISTCYLAD